MGESRKGKSGGGMGARNVAGGRSCGGGGGGGGRRRPPGVPPATTRGRYTGATRPRLGRKGTSGKGQTGPGGV